MPTADNEPFISVVSHATLIQCLPACTWVHESIMSQPCPCMCHPCPRTPHALPVQVLRSCYHNVVTMSVVPACTQLTIWEPPNHAAHGAGIHTDTCWRWPQVPHSHSLMCTTPRQLQHVFLLVSDQIVVVLMFVYK